MNSTKPEGVAQMIKDWNDMSFMEKMAMTQKILSYPALTLLVFIRHRPGYRSLNGTNLLIMAAIMEVIGQIFRDGALSIIAPVMLALGMVRRRIEWEAIRRGERWHTRSLGISYFAMLPFIPPFFHIENRLQRQYEPLLFVLLGLVIQRFDFVMGTWLVVAAVGLWGVEESAHEVAIARALDLMDSLIESEVHEENIEHFSGAKPGGQPIPPRPLQETAGIPTGIGQDIAAQIEARRKRDMAKRLDRIFPTGETLKGIENAGEVAAEGVENR